MKEIKKVFITGFALFAMFFGAGNILLPPYIGLLAGDKMYLSAIAFVLTGVGLPLLALLIVFKNKGDYKKLFKPMGDKFYKIFLFLGFLAIGPIIAIPRTAATSFEMGILPLFPNTNKLIFTFIFFVICVLFSLNETKVLDDIGKYLTPLLVLSLVVLIVSGIFLNADKLIGTNIEKPFKMAFLEGYNTLDAIAAIIFAQFIYKSVKNEKNPMRLSIKAAIVAAVGLSLVYIGLMYIGAKISVVNAHELSRTVLITEISKKVLGNRGIIVLAVIVIFACITTAIGVMTSVGDYFNQLFKNKLSYKLIIIFIAAISFLISQLEVDLIINLAVPILIVFYQVLMVLLGLTLFKGRIITDKVISYFTYTALIISIINQLQILFKI